MKKWLIGFSLFFLIICWQTIDLYFSIQHDKRLGSQEAERYIAEHDLGVIKAVSRYNGDQVYHIFTLEKDEQLKYATLDPKQGWQELAFESISFSMEDSIEKTKQLYPQIQKIERTVPVFIFPTFAWELVGYDLEKNLHYVYFSMSDGQFLRRYTVEHFSNR